MKSVNEKEVKNVLRYAFAMILSPVMLFSFWRLEEIAKGAELHYWGSLILNHSFVEIMFAAFIPLGIGTFLLLFSRIEEAPRLLKYILYSITILSLLSTLFVVHSLATVPRGSKQYSFHVSPDTFSGNITRLRNGEFSGEAYQTVFIQNYPTSLVVFGFLLGRVCSPTDYASARAQLERNTPSLRISLSADRELQTRKSTLLQFLREIYRFQRIILERRNVDARDKMGRLR